MWEFEDKIDPFFMPVRFSCGSSKQSIGTGKSLVENGDEIVFKHDFEFDVLVYCLLKALSKVLVSD